jgi:hypothetical protein
MSDAVTDRDIELVRKTIRMVAQRIQQDAESMSVSPRPKPPKFTVVAWETVAEFVRERESDILYDVTGFDDGR